MKHLPNIMLTILFLAMAAYVIDKIAFLEAWNRVKKVRVDRLEQGICE
jgi:hypothetical protein